MRSRYIPVEAHNFMMNLAQVGEFYYDGSAFALALAHEDLFDVAIDDRAAVLSDIGRAKLNRVAQAMVAYPDVICRIQSRIGDQGDATILQRQAEMCATTVTAYLMTKGIPTDRLTATGMSTRGSSNRAVAGLGRVELIFSRKASGTESASSSVENTARNRE